MNMAWSRRPRRFGMLVNGSVLLGKLGAETFVVLSYGT